MSAAGVLLAALQAGRLVDGVDDCLDLILDHFAFELLVAAAKADLALRPAILAVVQARAAPEQEAVVGKRRAGATKV